MAVSNKYDITNSRAKSIVGIRARLFGSTTLFSRARRTQGRLFPRSDAIRNAAILPSRIGNLGRFCVFNTDENRKDIAFFWIYDTLNRFIEVVVQDSLVPDERRFLPSRCEEYLDI